MSLARGQIDQALLHRGGGRGDSARRLKRRATRGGARVRDAEREGGRGGDRRVPRQLSHAAPVPLPLPRAREAVLRLGDLPRWAVHLHPRADVRAAVALRTPRRRAEPRVVSGRARRSTSSRRCSSAGISRSGSSGSSLRSRRSGEPPMEPSRLVQMRSPRPSKTPTRSRAATIHDRRGAARGALPRQVQTWIMLGLALSDPGRHSADRAAGSRAHRSRSPSAAGTARHGRSPSACGAIRSASPSGKRGSVTRRSARPERRRRDASAPDGRRARRRRSARRRTAPTRRTESVRRQRGVQSSRLGHAAPPRAAPSATLTAPWPYPGSSRRRCPRPPASPAPADDGRAPARRPHSRDRTRRRRRARDHRPSSSARLATVTEPATAAHAARRHGDRDGADQSPRRHVSGSGPVSRDHTGL